MSLPLASLPQWWWAHALDASVQVAWFALAVALLDVLLARLAAPELRTALWLAVLAKLLLPGAFPADLHWSVPDAVVPATLQGSFSDEVAGASSGSSLVSLAFGAWLAGILVLTVAGLTRYRNLRRKLWSGSDPAPAQVRALSQRVATRLGLSKPAPVRVFHGAGGPVVLGFLRPVVLVPHTLLAAERQDELELVLFHELAHVRRRDPHWSLLCLALQVLYWFHPLVWLARRRLSALRELSCDQTVGRALGGETQSYRRTLLTMAEPWAQGAPGPGLAFLTPRSQLLVRVRSLERPIPSSALPRRTHALVLFGLLFACVLPKAPALSVAFEHEIPPLEDLEGCLRLRYAVLAMQAHAETVEGSELAPLLNRSND